MAEETPIQTPPTSEAPNLPEIPAEEHSPTPKTPDSDKSRFQKLKNWYTSRKKWTIPASVLVFLLVLAGIPFTRYALAGTVVKRDLSVNVIDASAGTPVSGARVSVGSANALTDGTGKAILRNIKTGPHNVILTKKYYKDKTAKVLVPILIKKDAPAIQLTATGRQVKIRVANVISQQPLSNVDIKVADISAKTDKSGSATVVLPVGTKEQKARLSLKDYIDASVSVKISDGKIQENKFSLTPAGRIYFLSKLSGKIDVIKTNLDGTDRKTVLPGTGNEQDQGTVLLASRDWKYLALLSRRAGNSAALYLIDTSNDNLSTIDEGSADFSLNGWAGDNFIYTVTRNNVQLWQANRQALKSFNAPTKKLTILEQTTASGSGQSDYLSELIGAVYAYNDQIFFIKNWTASYTKPESIAGKQATFNSVKSDGSAKKAIRSFGMAAGTTAIDVTLEQRVESPNSIDLKFSDGAKDNFYVYANGQVKDQPNTTADAFYSAAYPTYLQSPSGELTFWSDERDGKNTLFTGDPSGQAAKQIASLSDYKPYGWYSDNYLLVSKNSSELYIMPKGGSRQPVKISDYHKPALTYSGYGGGYGGL